MSEPQKKTEITTTTNQPVANQPLSGQPLAPLPRGGSLLNEAFNRLPVEQQQDLLKTAVEERMKIEVSAAQSEQAHRDFQRDSMESVQQVRELGRTGVDFTGRYEGKTVNGRWEFEAKKSNYTVIIAIVAVIGIILLVVALR